MKRMVLLMHITVVGTGYVGLVSGAGLADFGLNVTCIDSDEQKIGALRQGQLPIYEIGMEDFMRPNRVVIGTDSEQAAAIIKDIYRPLYLIETPFVVTNLETAELIKYASNAFLATKI